MKKNLQIHRIIVAGRQYEMYDDNRNLMGATANFDMKQKCCDKTLICELLLASLVYSCRTWRDDMSRTTTTTMIMTIQGRSD